MTNERRSIEQRTSEPQDFPFIRAWPMSKRLAFDSTRNALEYLSKRSDLSTDERIAILRARHELFQAYLGQPETP